MYKVLGAAALFIAGMCFQAYCRLRDDELTLVAETEWFLAHQSASS